MKKLKSVFAIFVIASALASCTKEGPQGPAGQNGSNGQPGPTGPQGFANMNEVIMGASSGTWKGPYISLTGGYVWNYDFPISFLNQDIVDHGTVLVFRKLSYSNGVPYYVALPYGEVYDNNKTRLWGYEYSLYNVRINIEYTDDLSSHGTGGATFKFISIDGNGRSANPNINWNNYEAVKKAFNL